MLNLVNNKFQLPLKIVKILKTLAALLLFLLRVALQKPLKAMAFFISFLIF